ncbi:uncharacterized protein ACIB01_014328 [Guaruba guarouba]
MRAAGRSWGRRERALLWVFLVTAWNEAWGQLRYSVPEELPKGSFVGDVAKDLRLDLPALRDRGVRVISEGRTQHFALHGKTGHLVTAERIDREQLCRLVEKCVLFCEVVVDGEMQVYGIEVEITDINDNAPNFQEEETEIRVGETTALGSRFPLGEAHDQDSGPNSVQRYELSGDKHFSLAVQAGPDGDQRPELVLAKALDREEAAFHELVLKASDGGEPARTGTARIRVTVLDANDNAPVFSQAEYTVRVPEDVPVGSVLVTLKATDPDEGLNGHVKYSLKKTKDTTSQIFQLDSETGALTLVRSLDFEEGYSYELQAQAHDGGELFDTALVIITVTDVNDNVPEISVRTSLSQISEDAPSGTVVALLHVQDRDSGENGQVRCSIGENLPLRLEKTFKDYYRVVTAGELDREKVSEYNLTVRAVDGGSPALESSAVLALQVLDVNDNAPVFAEARYSARLAENNAAGALVLTVRATDADWGQNARVRYRLSEGRVRGAPLSSYVSVQAETGALYALRSFDYEEVREVRLWVWAEDGGAPALSSNVSVRLEIVDENDNAPQVLYPPPAAPSAAGSGWAGVELAPRSAEPGALVAKVVAVDADSGQNAWLSYELAKATEPGLFRVGLHSGEVRTARFPLARDAARQSLVVVVKDHGRPALSATATLTVVLAESVAELLSELGSAAAVPGEAAGSLTRWLVLAVAAVSCLFFAFLLLLLALRLRRWRRSQLPAASGSAALRGVPASHFVGIDGVRAFLHSYSHEVSLTTDSRKSHLRLSSGSCCDTLPARPAPDEPAPLVGEDLAAPRRADPAVPPVSVSQEPFSAPLLSWLLVFRAGEEAAPAGKVVCCQRVFIYVRQEISSDECGYYLCYELQSILYQLDPPLVYLLQLTYSEILSYDASLLQVPCSCLVCCPGLKLGLIVLANSIFIDSGVERTIYQFADKYAADLALIDSSGSKRLQLAGTRWQLSIDCDLAESWLWAKPSRQRPASLGACSAGRRLRAPLLTEEEREKSGATPAAPPAAARLNRSLARRLSPRLGGLRSVPAVRRRAAERQRAAGEKKEPQQRSEAGSFLRRSRAGSAAAEMSTAGRRWGRRERALLWGVLLAAWDAAWGQLRYSVPEELPKGSFVGDVAKDLRLDLPALRDRGVRLLDRGRTQYFALHGKTGHLVTTERIDREQLCRLVEKCVLRCEVIVEGDMQVYGIEVEITDINDNPPSFRGTETELRMSEATVPGSRFPLAEAHDPDLGSNSLQHYELNGDEHFSLAVQAGSGGYQRPELVLAKALDREEAAFHELVLRASDGGEPALTGTARIRVTVLDANDNAPVFNQAEYTVRVSEDVPVGSILLIITAADADEGLNGHVKYIFHKISDGASELFQLDSEKGAISLKESLDFEEISSHELEIQAHDGGGLFDTANVVIRVTDVNDNVPELTMSSSLSEISEDAPLGSVVALLHVQDRDSGENGQVRCSIVETLPFQLEKTFKDYYRVVTAGELDREKVSEYNVTVRAVDGGSPALESRAVLALRVLDVNDNAPVFAEARYSARLAENNAAGAPVLTVRASDEDWGQNARVRYRLVEGRVRGAPLSSYVSVQAETGSLYALRSFDYEEVCEVRLWVWAEDGGAPALSSNVSVRLEIVDENDNAPQVLYPPPAAPSAAGSGWAGVELAPRSAEPGALVAKVVAVDADSGQNAWLSYELAKATEPGLFRVGLHSGEVRTARFPLARDAARQSLVVVVKDHGRPALSATATLTVVLAESVAELLSELGSAAAVPSEAAGSLTRWLVLAVAAVSCLFFAFLLLLLALRLQRWRRSQLLAASGSAAVRGVPASHFVGIDGVRAFLHSYSHEVSLTADSRKSHLRLSSGSCCDTLPARPAPDEPAPLVGEDLAASRRSHPAAPTKCSCLSHGDNEKSDIIHDKETFIVQLLSVELYHWLMENDSEGVIFLDIALLGLQLSILFPMFAVQVYSWTSLSLLTIKTDLLHLSDRGNSFHPCEENESETRKEPVVLLNVEMENEDHAKCRGRPKAHKAAWERNDFQLLPEVNFNVRSEEQGDFQSEKKFTLTECNTTLKAFCGNRNPFSVGSCRRCHNHYRSPRSSGSRERSHHAAAVASRGLRRGAGREGRQQQEGRARRTLPTMAIRQRQSRRPAACRLLLPALMLCLCCRAAPERLRYVIPEELGRGSLVGQLARDLGLSPAELPARKLRLSAAKQYFTVSGENGNLYVSERLDREEMCGESVSCSVSFEAVVQNPLNVFHVDVAIQDVNDNFPRFPQDSFQLEINEFTSTGARFPLGTAEDADVGSNSLQSYELEDNEYFAVEVKESPDGSKFAELVLRRALDREREQSLRLALTAVDGGDPPRSGTAQLCINVTDANDNAPVFAQERYRVSLREDALPGSTVLNVSASDADAGSNARITYGFGKMPPKVLQKFMVDAESGRITLQKMLDFEDTRGYTLLVEARDGGGLLAHCNVEVEVLDVNDNAPEITVLSVSSPVPEDAPAGTVVALLNVKDPDSAENGQVWCELLGEAPLSLVASSGRSYKVLTASALDREQASEHRVTVVARDRGSPALSSSTALVLEVSDVNDNAPVFEEAAYSAYVAENNAAGALVLHVSARDADAGSNGRVRYSLEGGSAGSAPYVSVEAQSGAVYAQRSFDYEQCREFAVVVRAQDGGEPARSSTATVRVFVLDRNDNAPRVLWPAVVGSGTGHGAAPAAAPFEVVPRSAEAGYLVAKVVAVDADAGRNAWLSYELVQAPEPALFRVGLHSGEVRTARAVSEKDAAKQRLVAVVKDHGQPALSATATLHVVLAESLQEALPELSERAAGTDSAAELQFSLMLALALLSALFLLSVALAVLARGRRAGPPAVLRCLGVQRFSGAGAGAAFPADFCEGTLPYSYNLCVASGRAVAEASWPPLPVPCLPAEELLGGERSLAAGESPAEPNAPQLSQALETPDARGEFAFLLAEMAERITKELGPDGCSPRHLAGTMLRAPLLTEEEQKEGRSAAAAPPAEDRLDRSIDRSIAGCLGGPGVCKRPRSAEPAEGRGEEGAGAGIGGEELSAVEEMGAMERRWSRRKRALLCGVLMAALNAAWGQLHYSVPEELPKGSFVGNVAKDLGLDLPALRDRGVRVISEGRTQYFALHGKTGHLVTAERIDREQLCESVRQCVQRCEVILDGEMQVYGIEVEITDINDNTPSFEEMELEERMSESTAPGTRFLLSEAHDPDSGPNSLQHYELSGDEHFSLAVQAGPSGDQRPELVLAKALDREEAAFHELVLKARDGGEPARTGTARIRVTVLDANDNAPVFSQAEYTVRVSEDVPVGSILVTVRATDADEGLNGHVKYSLKKITAKASRILELDAETGALTLVQPLDFEEGDSHELQVQARDGGELFDTAKIVITVTDVNDNAPEISVRSALTEISEDASPGTVVALLYVQDKDSGVNGQVRCSLDEGVPFRLRSSKGSYYSVVTAGELDREKVSEYNLTVRAVDGGSPALESSAVLALRVLDVNDNAPVFAEARYSAWLTENNAAGSLVLTVRATDADWGQNARVRYRLSEGRVRGAPLSSYVSVQAETGALYALRSFDYEEVREVRLWVWAEDGGAPALNSNVSVRLEIVDENDNAPQVLYPPPAAPSAAGSGWAGVELAPRSVEPGALVAKVVAVDADSGQNAWLSYELAKATEPGLFRVGLHSGEVRTARFPLARDAARQSLVVVVKDHGRPALSATATLTVVLAESVAELLSELGSAAAVPSEAAGSLTRWLVLAVAAVSCLFFAFLLLLLALRLRRWRRSQLLAASGSAALRGVPASHFVGIDGVRAFLHSYSHEVSLTADSRKSHLRLSSGSCCDTLPARPVPDEPAPLVGEDLAISRHADPVAPPVSSSQEPFSTLLPSLY